MKKFSLLILLCLLFTVGKAQITVESGSPQLNTETSIGLVLSDPTNFGYVAGTSTYNVFIEKAGTTYYSSYSSFTMTNVGSGVYHLSSTVGQDVVPVAGTYDVRVYDASYANTFNCSDCFTFTCLDNTGTDTQVACDSYTWIDGITYTTSNNTATYTLTNWAGCDSVVTLNLTINTVDVTVTNTSPTLTANQTGATYQWIDCDNNNEPIAGETGQNFTATENGNYAVIVTYNNCIDTSDCVTISGIVGINNFRKDSGIRLYPNPAKTTVFLEFGKVVTDADIYITDITGKPIYTFENVSGNKISIPVKGIKKGIYFMQVKNKNELTTIKLLIE